MIGACLAKGSIIQQANYVIGALQVDPAMALLNEWFMTHKADEVTYGLVKMLDEIGR